METVVEREFRAYLTTVCVSHIRSIGLGYNDWIYAWGTTVCRIIPIDSFLRVHDSVHVYMACVSIRYSAHSTLGEDLEKLDLKCNIYVYLTRYIRGCCCRGVVIVHTHPDANEY